MEQELGHSLFIRRKGYRNAQLTDQGAEFYRIAWNKDFKSWTFCPYTTAIRLQKNGACIYELKNSPPEQVVYYLVNENRKTATIHKFLKLLAEKLKTLPKDKITSFLS